MAAMCHAQSQRSNAMHSELLWCALAALFLMTKRKKTMMAKFKSSGSTAPQIYNPPERLVSSAGCKLPVRSW